MRALSHSPINIVKHTARYRHGRALQTPHISKNPFERRQRGARGNFASRVTAMEFAVTKTVHRMLARSRP
jgi:hypothetical protein